MWTRLCATCSLRSTTWLAVCLRRPISPPVRGIQISCSLAFASLSKKALSIQTAEVAAKTGISLRDLQKLFTERGSTCSEFIYSARLDHAARLLGRRESLRNGQPLRKSPMLAAALTRTRI
jgi:AraC-like DNA-binding protein